MLSLFNSRPVIDESSSQWLFDCFDWALKNFDSTAFYQSCQLILPTNAFFPDRVNSVHSKAKAIFLRVQAYTGMAHWPFTLVRPENFISAATPHLDLDTTTRRPLMAGDAGDFSQSTEIQSLTDNNFRLLVSYLPQQVKKPDAMAATYGHILAQHLVYQSRQTPPGGGEYFPQATEVVASFMGFGLLLSNSAYTFRTGCGSCYDPGANRNAVLSEAESVYALAIFCTLKEIPNATVFKHLKKHLRGVYRKSVRQINRQPQQLSRLRAYKSM